MDITIEHEHVLPPAALQVLPEDREQWPHAAVEAHDALVSDLNRWSRDNDWPSTLNSWIAEEAVRRSF